MRRFLTAFLILQVVLFATVEHVTVKQALVVPWTEHVFRICSWLVTQFDQNAQAIGNLLWSPAHNVGVAIESGCVGVEASITLVAAILAFPTSWRNRIWGLGAGLLAVQALNLVRIISLYYLMQWNRVVFDFAHNYIWQGLIMLDVLLFWLFWVRRSQSPDPVLLGA